MGTSTHSSGDRADGEIRLAPIQYDFGAANYAQHQPQRRRIARAHHRAVAAHAL